MSQQTCIKTEQRTNQNRTAIKTIKPNCYTNLNKYLIRKNLNKLLSSIDVHRQQTS